MPRPLFVPCCIRTFGIWFDLGGAFTPSRFFIFNLKKIMVLSIFKTKHKKVNHNLYIRLLKYKDIKKMVDSFCEWEERNTESLQISWKDYIDKIKFIPYQEYCENFYNGTLEGVVKKSYYNSLK
jgi:hypothetical protein